uniref:Peptidase M13 C-terminal domain-containing protein n=1 Tax=viral metagenome TaxID=1070528 RepID=A0A6C0J6C1_9ZZZZ
MIKDDFYQYINNNWLNNTDIPNHESRWGTFNILAEDNLNKIKLLLEDNVNCSNPDFIKLCNLYIQSLNITNTKPKEVVKTFLDKINTINDKVQLQDFINNQFFLYGISTPVSYYVDLDLHTPYYILHVGTAGLGLPDKEYYLDDNYKDICKKYKIFMKEYLELFDLNFDIDTIFNLEKILAKNTYSAVEKRNPELMDNLYLYEDFNNNFKELNIHLLFNNLKKNNKNIGKINVLNPKFLKNNKGTGYIDLWNNLPLNIWKEYFIWLYLRKLGNYIHYDTEIKLFNFYNKDLEGIKEMKPLWKRSINKCEILLGPLLGQLYVSKYFSIDDKNKVLKIIKFIKNTFKHRLLNNEWMTSVTIDKAITKLNKMNFKIGYPDKWRDFKNYNISNKFTFFENVLICLFNDTKYYNNYIGEEKDLNQWFMNSHEVNAYYSPQLNEIVFPAGILQYPFYSSTNNIGLNFGGIGCVIGHEIIHGFDDQGRKYDGNGQLVNWWNEGDKNNFIKLTDKLVDIYSNIKIYDKNVNGKLTLGENIADLGGVNIAYYALINYLDENQNENICTKKYDCFQQFFINYANIWKCKYRKEALLKRILVDPHSPPKVRSNVILSLFKPFYKHFNITKDDKMYRDININIF